MYLVSPSYCCCIIVRRCAAWSGQCRAVGWGATYLVSIFIVVVSIVLRAQVSNEQQGWEPLTWFPSCPRVAVTFVIVAGKGLVEVVVEVEVELNAKQKISTRSCDVGV